MIAAPLCQRFLSHGRWVGGAGLAARLLTLSYDGSLRCLDPGAGCAFQVRPACF